MPSYHSLQSTPTFKEPEAFCECRQSEKSSNEDHRSRIGTRLLCSCGEELNVHEWAWDSTVTTVSTRLSMNDREITFHPIYSNGTAAIRGNMPFVINNDYYWEIKMLTPLYGTDVMIGVGTRNADLHGASHNFCSLLGCDEESWGYSYRGTIQHKGRKESYGPSFGHGSIVGVHLDMWKGTLQFYLNRKPLGIAFTTLRGQTLYPMMCSTTAKTSMRVIYSASEPSTLQLMCFQNLSSNSRLVKVLKDIPFLRSRVEKEYWWLIPSENSDIKNDEGYDSVTSVAEVMLINTDLGWSSETRLSDLLRESNDDLDILSENSDDESDDVNLLMCMDMIRESSQTSENCAEAKVERQCKKKSRIKKELIQSSDQNPAVAHNCYNTRRSNRRLCNYCDIIL